MTKDLEEKIMTYKEFTERGVPKEDVKYFMSKPDWNKCYKLYLEKKKK